MNIFKLFIIVNSFVSLPALAEVYTFECDYPTYSDKAGVQESNGFEVKFVSDTSTGKTYMSGNNGSTEVAFFSRADDQGFNIVETTNSGNIMVTTIMLSGASVHSRNSAIMGEIIPSQYYGSCDFK
jgi:hypothetical protein